MNITRNPRLMQRRMEKMWGRCMALNVENLATLVITLNKLYPKQFYNKAVRGFFDNYADTVAMFNAYTDNEVKTHRIDEYLAECPYINDALILRLVQYFKRRTVTTIDKCIYNEPDLVALLGENLTLMLIQLHYDYGFGEDRILRTVDSICSANIPDPVKTLDELFDIAPEEDEQQLRDEVKRMEQARRNHKRGVRVTAREQTDAGYALEALKKYQDEINTR